MSVQKMLAKDAISASMAECVIVIKGQRLNFMQAIELTASSKKTKKKVPILGQVAKGNKSVGIEYTGKAKFHYNTSIFNELMYELQEDGKDLYFDIIVTNYDPTSTVGKQTVILKDCNLDGNKLASFNADEDILTDEIDFTFEKFKLVESFKELPGMQL